MRLPIELINAIPAALMLAIFTAIPSALAVSDWRAGVAAFCTTFVAATGLQGFTAMREELRVQGVVADERWYAAERENEALYQLPPGEELVS